MTVESKDAPVRVGELVIVIAEPALGVHRVERALDVDGVESVRILSYDDGSLLVRAIGAVAPCPPGTRVAC